MFMQTQNENENFRFTYSAKEQEELKKIRQKYLPQEENKMDKLRKIDAIVTKKAIKISIIIGIIGTLIMGTGMSIAMTDLGEKLGFEGIVSMIIGVIIGIIGIIIVCFTYPIYNYILKKERKKVAPEVIKLTDELMK